VHSSAVYILHKLTDRVS